MATKIKDQATATEAALALNAVKGTVDPVSGEPKTPAELSTGQKLFPEFVTDDGALVNRPIKPYEDKSKPLPVVATPPQDPQSQNPSTVVPTAPSYLKIDEMTGKMAKVKVDGVEMDVPAESLIKNFQLERTLNSRLENLAEERRRLEQERASFTRQPIPTQDTPAPQSQPKPQSKKSAEVEALEAQFAQYRAETEARIAGLQTTLLPQIQEAGVKRLSNLVKEKLGADDFSNYFEKIRDESIAEANKPENINNEQARKFFDSDSFYFQKYQEFKLKDLIAGQGRAPQVAPNTPVLQNAQGAPVVFNQQGQPVSIPAIEGSGGVPSRSSSSGDWAAKAQAAFDRARATGQTSDWQVYYRLKSEGPA